MTNRAMTRNKFRAMRRLGMEFILAHKVSKLLTKSMFFRLKAEELGADVQMGCPCCGDWTAVFTCGDKKICVNWIGNIF